VFFNSFYWLLSYVFYSEVAHIVESALAHAAPVRIENKRVERLSPAILHRRCDLAVEGFLMIVTCFAMLAPITVVLVLLTILIRLQFSHFCGLTVHLMDFIENVGSRLFLSEGIRAI